MKDFVLWIMWGPFRNLALKVSNKRLSQFGTIAGYISYMILSKRKSVLKKEYHQIFPEKSEKEINKIILKYFILRSLIEIEEILCTQLSKDNIDQVIKITNEEYIKESLSLGKGVILATFHFGPHLQIMPALGVRGYKVNQVAVKWKGDRKNIQDEPPPGYIANKLFQARIKHSGDHLHAKIIPLEQKSSPRPLFRCLKNNEILIIAFDGREVGNSLKVPFFSHQSYRFASGPVNLALRTGSPIHPVFVVKHGMRQNELIIEKKISIDSEGDSEKRISYSSKEVVKVLEDYVAKYPCHYGNEIFHEKLKIITAQSD